MTNDQYMAAIKELLARKSKLNKYLSDNATDVLQPGTNPKPLDLKAYSSAIKESELIDVELASLNEMKIQNL